MSRRPNGQASRAHSLDAGDEIKRHFSQKNGFVSFLCSFLSNPTQEQERIVVTSIKAHRFVTALVAFVLVLVISGATASTPGLADTCANETIRANQAATFLPDCRAYELVSPPGATAYLAPGNGTTTVDGARAAAASTVEGAAIGWFSFYPPPDLNDSSMQLLSVRSSSGWNTQDVISTQSANPGGSGECGGYMYFSSGLEKGILGEGRLSIGAHQPSQECGHNEPALVEDEPEGFENLFFHDLASGEYRLVNLTPADVAPADAELQDGSSNLDHVVFSEGASLTVGAPEGEDLYVWFNGALHLVSVLPDGTPVSGRLVDGTLVNHLSLGFSPFVNAVSADGSRVFFEADGNLYVRENPAEQQSALGIHGECLEQAKACTIQIDAAEPGGVGGGGTFLAANAAGTEVVFSAGGVKKLTNDTVPSSGQNLYEFNIETGVLTNVAPLSQVELMGLVALGEGAQGEMRLYIVANGSLSGANTEGHSPQPGLPNLYEIKLGGPPVFIATLTQADHHDWEEEFRTASASPDGRYLAFGSVSPLTGYDNLDAQTGNPDSELFLYDVVTESLKCVSCVPGVSPTSSTGIQATEKANTLAKGPGYLRRNVLDNGRVFFDTSDALVPEDINSQSDVYEYENEHLNLISTGTSSAGSYFYEASGKNAKTGEEGEDAYFATTQRLIDSDTANGPVLYDARIGGGFEAPASATSCDENCRGQSQGLALSTPVSMSFSGQGNPPPPPPPPPPPSPPHEVKAKACKKGFVKRHNRCIRKKSKTKQKAKRATARGKRHA